MRICILLVTAAFCTTLGGIGSALAGTPLTFKAGLGYEFLSQEFFLDSLELYGIDSLDVTTFLKTTYLDDFKGQLTLGYLPFEDHRLEVKAVLEQTPDQYRLQMFGDYHPTWGAASLDLYSELGWRDGEADATKGDPGYLSGYGRAKLMLPASRVVSLWAQAKSDFVDFDSIGPGTFNYHRLGGQVGISHTFSNFSSLTIDLFLTKRSVPGSSDQDYLSRGLEGFFLGFYPKGEIDVLAGFETRDYNRPADLGDYRRTELTVRNRHDLGGSFFAREELELEELNFDSTDYATINYRRGEISFLIGLAGTCWSFAAGPDFEILSEEEISDFVVGEGYLESGLKAQFDIVKPGLLFQSLESVIGRRDLKDEGSGSDLHSDFLFERFNLMIDWSIAGGLGLSLLFSADWEWHENPEENSRLFLVSSGVYYTF